MPRGFNRTTGPWALATRLRGSLAGSVKQASSGPRRPAGRIERASPTDRAFLAMDHGTVPEQFGVILTLDAAGGFDLVRARWLIAKRLPAIPRLRQRLVRTPLGCGAPIWIDDNRFDIGAHVRAVACAEPGDEAALLDAALPVIMTPLRRTAPLWSAVFITGCADGSVALLLVLSHVLADGIGGLTVLAGLIDGAAQPHATPFPRPGPSRARVTDDALAARLQALRDLPRSWHLLRASMSAGGGLWPPRAEPCSLNQRTGPRRALAVVHADLGPLRTATHRYGATVNDAILVAVTGALHRVLLARGESVRNLALTVPVSGRRASEQAALGNMVSPMLVQVPATGSVAERLTQVSARVRAEKTSATGPPPIALLGWLFRPLAAAGGYRWYMNHQRRFHTLVSHVRGPADRVTFGGWAITSAIPVVVGNAGNATVCFEVLSYAGKIAVTAVADPSRFPDLASLAAALHEELDLVARAGAVPPGPPEAGLDAPLGDVSHLP
jgi:diacylglycerol O-acyltransferase